VTESAAPAQPPCETASQPCVDKAVLAAVILDWRLQGHTLTRIARDLPQAGHAPLSVLQINRIVQGELKRAAKLSGEPRSIELMRLDQLQAAHYPKALAGEGAATDRVLAIMDRRAKLLGLHAPRASEDAPETADARQKLLEKLEAMAARTSGAGVAPTVAAKSAIGPIRRILTSLQRAGDRGSDVKKLIVKGKFGGENAEMNFLPNKMCHEDTISARRGSVPFRERSPLWSER
jgi:hypothetical protein